MQTARDPRVVQADKEYEEWQKKQAGVKKSIGLTHLLRKSDPYHGYHGYFASAPAYSIYPQPMDASKLLPKCKNPNDKKEQREYIDLFMQQFGGTFGKSVSFTDASGKKLNISPRMFKDRKTGEYKIFKNGREQYLLMLAEALKNPTEIWEDTETRKGKPTTIRRYVATYQLGGERVSGTIVFDLMNGRWEGTTAHQRKNPDVTRTGNLIYTAQGIKKSRLLCQTSDPLPALAIKGARTCKRHAQNISKPENDVYKSIKTAVHNDIRFLPYLIKSRALHGRIDFNGLQVSIETGRSRVREWYNPQDGSQGISRMTLPYGYFKGTLATDGDAVDVFVGPDHHAKEVYVVHTTKAPDFTEYDEDKTFIGLNTPEEAFRAFHASYSEPRFYGSMSIWPIEEFKEALVSMRGKKLKSINQYLPPTESDNSIATGPGRLFREDELRDRAQRYIDEATTPLSREALLAMSKKGVPMLMAKSSPFVQNVREAWQAVTKSTQYDKEELEQGMKEEQEHSDVVDGDQSKIRQIVQEHLAEDPNYYSNIKRAKKLGIIKTA